MNVRVFTIFLAFILYLFLFAPSVQAKLLPQAKSPGKKVSSQSSSIGVYPRLRADKKAVLVSFSNLNNAQSVSYMLTYTTNGQQEAAMGGLDLNKSSQTQEILFGTCSKNVCRYHSGISNAKLEVSYTAKSGKKYLKKFRIKI